MADIDDDESSNVAVIAAAAATTVAAAVDNQIESNQIYSQRSVHSFISFNMQIHM